MEGRIYDIKLEVKDLDCMTFSKDVLSIMDSGPLFMIAFIFLNLRPRPRNMNTQYAPRLFDAEKQQEIFQSEEVLSFLKTVVPRLVLIL